MTASTVFGTVATTNRCFFGSRSQGRGNGGSEGIFGLQRSATSMRSRQRHAQRQPSVSASALFPVRTRHHHSSSSPSSSSCFYCFGRSAAVQDVIPSPPAPSRSPSSWLRSKLSEHIKCPNFISNVGKNRYHSADFRYDPLSYALNFDEGFGEDTTIDSADDIRYRSFAARLPASPPSSRFSSVQPH